MLAEVKRLKRERLILKNAEKSIDDIGHMHIHSPRRSYDDLVLLSSNRFSDRMKSTISRRSKNQFNKEFIYAYNIHY